MKVFSFEKYKNWCIENHQQFFDLLELCDGKTGIERDELGFTFLSCDEWSIDSSTEQQNQLVSAEVDKTWRAVFGVNKDAEQTSAEATIEVSSPTRYHIIITDPFDNTSTLSYHNEALVASIDTGAINQIVIKGLKVYVYSENESAAEAEVFVAL